jgi:hypothetical protein
MITIFTERTLHVFNQNFKRICIQVYESERPIDDSLFTFSWSRLCFRANSYSSLSQRPQFVPRPGWSRKSTMSWPRWTRCRPVTFGLARVASLNSICPPKRHAVGATMVSSRASSSPTVRKGRPRPATQLRRSTRESSLAFAASS